MYGIDSRGLAGPASWFTLKLRPLTESSSSSRNHFGVAVGTRSAMWIFSSQSAVSSDSRLLGRNGASVGPVETFSAPGGTLELLVGGVCIAPAGDGFGTLAASGLP